MANNYDTTFGVRVTKQIVERLKEIARTRAFNEKRDFSASDLVRELIEQYLTKVDTTAAGSKGDK